VFGKYYLLGFRDHSLTEIYSVPPGFTFGIANVDYVSPILDSPHGKRLMCRCSVAITNLTTKSQLPSNPCTTVRKLRSISAFDFRLFYVRPVQGKLQQGRYLTRSIHLPTSHLHLPPLATARSALTGPVSGKYDPRNPNGISLKSHLIRCLLHISRHLRSRHHRFESLWR